MRLISFLCFSFSFLVLSGCASMNTPSASLIETKPVVTIGEPGNAAEDHIVFIPASTKFPIKFAVTGNIFTEEASSEVMVSLKEDIYLYKYWASLDGKLWVNSHKLLHVEPSGGFDKSGGEVAVKLNLVK